MVLNFITTINVNYTSIYTAKLILMKKLEKERYYTTHTSNSLNIGAGDLFEDYIQR